MHFSRHHKICLEPANIEEEEVCKMIRECLDLRKKYVYKENIVPWKTEPVATNSDPFHFEPVEATTVSLLHVHYCCVSQIFSATCGICLSY